MAAGGLAIVMPCNDEKHIHPFFSTPNGLNAFEPSFTPITDEAHVNNSDEGTDVSALDGASDRPRKIRKTNKGKSTQEKATGKAQQKLVDLINQNRTQPCIEENAPANESHDVKESYPAAIDESLSGGASQSKQLVVGSVPAAFIRNSPVSSLRELTKEDGRDVREVEATENTSKIPSTTSKTPPRKMLRLNASGKFSSPVSRLSAAPEGDGVLKAEQKQTKRGRPRKQRGHQVSMVMMVRLKYGQDECLERIRIGNRINTILSGKAHATQSSASPSEAKIVQPIKDSKPTHPFFVGLKKEKHQSLPCQRKVSASTPGKLMYRTTNNEPAEILDAPFTSALLKDRLMVRHPGIREASWPNSENTHVRDMLSTPMNVSSSSSKSRGKRSSKLPVLPHYSVVDDFAKQLIPDREPGARADGYTEPHAALNLPTKLLISGEQVAERVESDLATLVRSDSVDELSLSFPSQTVAPAVLKLRDELTKLKSAMLTSDHEQLSWPQKHAPRNAAEILQSALKTSILKNWLSSLKVSATEASPGLSRAKATEREERNIKKPRRRKVDDLDDFLVDDDDNVVEMEDISDEEDGARPKQYRQTRSCIQNVGNGRKPSNAVLLFGPHGCGKTAAAYAAATELGFKVFEIGPGERRSGKDVLDRVGNMAENHLVKHHGTDAELSAGEDHTRWDDAFRTDLESGRQGNLGSFFKGPKACAKSTSNTRTLGVSDKLTAMQKVLKRSNKEQKQSLILLEEVDVLFRDDKEFWSTVIKLIVASKRPCILTCSDPSVVPLGSLQLHAMLRFEQPAVDDAVDLMLLIAANEGHLLKRAVVSSLYQYKKHDLRASITELSFWCQLGIGDPKSGLSWIYQRWPPGSDIDADGRHLRVISEDSCRLGTGLLPDAVLSCDDIALLAWSEFDAQPVDSFGFAHIQSESLTNKSSDDLLRNYSMLTDTLSAIDVYTAHAANETRLDTTQKPLRDSARASYTDGLSLLQTDYTPEYSQLSRKLSIALTRLALSDFTGKTSEEYKQSLTTVLQTGCSDLPVDRSLSRYDFTCFDPIAEPAENPSHSQYNLQMSSFDGPFNPIATDVAPYVRSIVQYDQFLEERRNMLYESDDLQRTRRARTTRAARSALEGGQREFIRREKWFSKDLDAKSVLATAGPDWPHAYEDAESADNDGTVSDPNTQAEI